MSKNHFIKVRHSRAAEKITCSNFKISYDIFFGAALDKLIVFGNGKFFDIVDPFAALSLFKTHGIKDLIKSCPGVDRHCPAGTVQTVFAANARIVVNGF